MSGNTIDLSFLDGLVYAESGFNVHHDLVTHTIDGLDLNPLWTEFQQAIDVVNRERIALASLFTFDTTNPADYLVQVSGGVNFELATEFGEPQGARPGTPDADPMGYPLNWYDVGARYTWKYLRDATAQDLQRLHNQVIEADNKRLYTDTMNALLRPTNTRNESDTPVYSLWNGTDGKAPPTFAGQEFDPGHSHYLVSGAPVIDAGDVEDLCETVTHHGYGPIAGDTLVVLANPQEAKRIASFRANVAGASYDFIPSDAAPAYLTTETLVGQRPNGTFHGLKVIGSYGGALIVEDYRVPAGYLIGLATGGPNSTRNPLGFRQHIRSEYRGLRLLSGGSARYPLVDSFYSRGFGVGVRHRGAAAVMQIKESGPYAKPALVF